MSVDAFGDVRISDTQRVPTNNFGKEADVSQDVTIMISSTSKLAGQNVAPFLAEHIPNQYAPLGVLERPTSSANKDPNSKYCYRHRPDLKCRRQANEPSMDQLQHVSMAILAEVEININNSIGA